MLWLLVVAALLARASAQQPQIFQEVRQCVEEADFGNTTLVCDPHNRLANGTEAKLETLLRGLQEKITCTCIDGCLRADGTDTYRGMILVTNSYASKNLSADMDTIYKERGMGNETCQHGLFLAYLKDMGKLASYRGRGNFVLLTDEDMIKLHELARKGDGGSDAQSLQFLLNNYKDIVEAPVQRAESWMPVIGLIAAILLVLIALAILMSLFLARFCCCCVKRNKEVYHVTPVPSYKTVEPIYVVTPNSGVGYPPGPHSEALYSTPYSGSPLPLPYPPPPGASRPITPASARDHRLRVRPSNVSGSGGSNPSPPQPSKVQRMTSQGRSPIEEDPDYAAVPAPGGEGYGTMRETNEMYASLPRHPMMMMPPPSMGGPGSRAGTMPRGPPHPMMMPMGHMPPLMMPPPGGSLPRGSPRGPLPPLMMPPPGPGYGPPFMIPSPRSEASSGNRTGSIAGSGAGGARPPPTAGGDLSFLDPNRKRETQTREEMIY